MSILNKFNEGKRFNYDGEKERDFTNFEELYFKNGADEKYTVEALFINTKGKYGHAPVIVISDYLVNAPSHMTDTVKEMRSTDDLVDMVNDRKVGFKLYEYKNQHGKAYSCEWIEL